MKEFLIELAQLMKKHEITLVDDSVFDGENNYTDWNFVSKDCKIRIDCVGQFVTNVSL